jgi:glutathione S-transferase
MAMEKTVAFIYEALQRPESLQHAPWLERVGQQLSGAMQLLSQHVADGENWLAGARITQADVSVAVAWRFVRHIRPELVPLEDFAGLARFSDRAEALPEFIACPFE